MSFPAHSEISSDRIRVPCVKRIGPFYRWETWTYEKRISHSGREAWRAVREEVKCADDIMRSSITLQPMGHKALNLREMGLS